MVIRISKKFAVLFIIILMFDLLLEMLLETIELIAEFVHLIFEFFEYMLELMLEHIFHASHHESETIIINIAIILTLYGLYRYLHIAPNQFRSLKRRIKLNWLKRIRKESACWHSLSLNRKIKVSLVYLVGITATLFLLTI